MLQPSYIQKLSGNEVMYILNRLAPFYHTGFGFQANGEKSTETQEMFVTFKNQEEIDWFEEYEADLYGFENYKQVKFSDAVIEKEYLVYFELDMIHRLIQSPIPSKQVTLKYSRNRWGVQYEKLKANEWYNHPSTWWNNGKPDGSANYFMSELLPFLKSRSYIDVVEPFMEITLSTEQKGGFLTIEDILFATRGLAFNDQCCIDEGYKILDKSTKEHLMIEPQSLG